MIVQMIVYALGMEMPTSVYISDVICWFISS